jgi:hypothetical protein
MILGTFLVGVLVGSAGMWFLVREKIISVK